MRNTTNLQTFFSKDHHYESFFLSKDSLPCGTHSLDHCILFKFIFYTSGYIPTHSCLMDVLLVLIAHVIAHVLPTLKYHCQVPCHQEGSLDAIYGLISMFPLIVSSTVPKTTDIFQYADTSKNEIFIRRSCVSLVYRYHSLHYYFKIKRRSSRYEKIHAFRQA